MAQLDLPDNSSTSNHRRPRTAIAQFIAFAGVGALATSLQYLVLVVLARAGCDASLASAAGYVAGALLGYWLNYHYTFHSTSQHGKAIAKFAAIACVGLALNTAIMVLLTRGLLWHYLVSQIFATGIVLIWNFAANRRWTFNHGTRRLSSDT